MKKQIKIMYYFIFFSIVLNIFSKVMERYTVVGQLYPFFSWSLVSSALIKKNPTGIYHAYRIRYQYKKQSSWIELPCTKYNYCENLAEFFDVNEPKYYLNSKIKSQIDGMLDQIQNPVYQYKIVKLSFAPKTLINDTAKYNEQLVSVVKR